MIAAFTQDVRYAIRQLRKSPGFAAVALLTLAAGIASTCVVFSIVDAVLLRPLSFPNPQQLVSIGVTFKPANGDDVRVSEPDISFLNFADWRAQAKSFSSLSATKVDGFTLTDRAGGPSQHIQGGVVSSDFFTTLGIAPVLGRGFLREEERAGNRSIVIGSALWQSQFANAADVLGKHVRLSDEDFTVVGVMGRGFQYPVDSTEVQFWVTMARDAEGKNASATQRGWSQYEVLGRMRAGVTAEQATSELNAIQLRLAAQYPEDDKNMVGAKINELRESVVGDVKQPLNLLFGSVFFLLLIACANVAGLLLARANGRRAEISIRASLGASRARIVRQVLAESLCLALAGGALGLALAMVALRMAPLYIPEDLPRVHDVALNPTVAAFAFGISLLTGLIFGVVPAWRASRLNPADAMRDGSRGMTAGKLQQRTQSLLVIAETAVGLILLIGAGLMLRSLERVLHVNPGFAADHLLTCRIATPAKSYSDDQRTDFFNRLQTQLEALPGVQSATGAFPLPLAGGDIHIGFSIVGQKTAPGDEPSARLSIVQPKFFETLRIPLLTGRFFNAADHRANGVQVMMVNRAFERRFFSDGSALGKRVQTNVGVTDAPIREIVGVVGDVKRANLTEEDQPEYYLPIEQGPIANPIVAMRVSGEPLHYEAQVRALVAKMDSSLPVYRVTSYDEHLARLTARQRFIVVLLSAFASVALLLSGVGLYGLLSYMVSQRAREIGLRMALGAPRASVQRLFLLRGLTLSAIGLAAGSAAAALLTRFIANMLFGIGRFDAATFAVTAGVLLLVSLMASLVPAYRASRLDPMQALRAE